MSLCSSAGTNCFAFSDPFSVPRLAVNTVTNSDVEYRAERSDTATERVITGYDVFRFGVPMIGVYGNAEIRRSFSISPVVPGAQYRIRAWAIGGVASSSNRRSEVPAVEYVTTGTASELYSLPTVNHINYT